MGMILGNRKKVGMILENSVQLNFLLSTLEQIFMCADFEFNLTVASQIVHS